MPTQIQKQIEEAMTRLEPKLKPLYKSGSFDVFNLKVAIEKELSTIATKSAEVERERLTRNALENHSPDYLPSWYKEQL